jgi:hypothetical protein
MQAIVSDLNAYGTDARYSAMADFAELVAYCAGRDVTEGYVADLVNDYDGNVPDDKFGVGDPALDELPRTRQERASEFTSKVFGLLKSRRQALGTGYPFRFVSSGVLRYAPRSAGPQPYLGLLAITAIHAFDLDVDFEPRLAFESVVAEALRGTNLIVVNLSKLRRKCGSYPKALRAGLGTHGIRCDPDVVVRRLRAHEQGVDVVAAIAWGDLRMGRLTMLCQVTCGNSDSWQEKIGEPRTEDWRKMMGETVLPVAALAVPHHVEDLNLAYLSESGRIVIDRLRLCRLLRSVPRALVRASELLAAAPIEP